MGIRHEGSLTAGSPMAGLLQRLLALGANTMSGGEKPTKRNLESTIYKTEEVRIDLLPHCAHSVTVGYDTEDTAMYRDPSLRDSTHVDGREADAGERFSAH